MLETATTHSLLFRQTLTSGESAARKARASFERYLRSDAINDSWAADMHLDRLNQKAELLVRIAGYEEIGLLNSDQEAA